jgi:hypothetical protein
MWVTKHGWKQFRVHGIAENRDEGEEQEQNNVENEHDFRDNVEPVSIEWYLMEHDRQSSRAHSDYEPTVKKQYSSASIGSGWTNCTYDGVKLRMILWKSTSVLSSEDCTFCGFGTSLMVTEPVKVVPGPASGSSLRCVWIASAKYLGSSSWK